MANNVSVKVSADIIDLKAKFAVARAESQALQKDLNSLARQANTGGTTTGLQADLLKAAEASTIAQNKVNAIGSELRKFGQDAEAGGHASHGALRYYRELFDEFSSGRTKYVPSTLATLLTQFYGISGGALAAGGALVAVVGGIAYLAYEAAEASHQLDDLATSFALTGRQAEFSREQIEYQLDFLRQLPGVSSDAAEGFVKFASANAQVNNYMANQVGQLLPAFEAAYGEKAPEAAGKLAVALSNLTETGFRKLDQEMLNLPPAAYEQIQALIRVGDTAEATALILQHLSQSSGVYIKSLGDQVYDVEQAIKQTQDTIRATENNPMAGMYGGAQEIGALEDKLTQLKRSLVAIREEERKQASEGVDRQYKAQIDDAEKLNERLDERGRYTRAVTQYENDLAQAEKRHDASGIVTFTKALANARQELAKYDQEASHNTFKQSGFSNEGAQLIAQARETVSQINTEESIGGAQRLAEIRNVYNQILASGKLNAAQRVQVQEQLNRDIAQANRQSAREQEQIDQDNLRTKIELAKIAYQDKKAELDNEVAAGRISKAQELQILVQSLNEVERLQIQALTDQEKNYGQDTLNFARAENQKKIIAAQTNTEIARLTAQLTATQEKQQFDLQSTVLNSEGQLVRGVISGRQSMVSILGGIAEKMAEDWLTAELKTLTETILVESRKTDATEAAVAMRNAAEKGGLAQGLGAQINAGSAQIMNNAYQAASGAYSAVVGIPVIGPVLAPAAAATAFAAVAAFDTLTSAAGGQWQVPFDGQLTMLHQDEMVLPAWAAGPLRSAVSTSPTPGATGSGLQLIAPVTIQAIDTQTGLQFVRQHILATARMVAQEWNKNQSLRPSY